jgi:uncharacterized membrane protein (DUF373 family)
MKYYKNIQKNYDISETDLKNISTLKDLMKDHREEFTEDVFAHFKRKFTLSEHIMEIIETKHAEFLRTWYDKFFDAKYNNAYLAYLEKFGELQKKYGIDFESINVMMSYMRLWLHERIFQNIDDEVERKELLLSMHKIMDVNIDAINNSFCEHKIKDVTSVFGARNFVVNISEQFSLLMHTMMVGILITMTSAAAVIFLIEVLNLLTVSPDKALLTALGSLLMIWVLVELLRTEIQMLKGGKFKISIFIGVALIAFIRDLLIITLKHETSSIYTYGFVLVSIAVLGIIYWLISKTEK